MCDNPSRRSTNRETLQGASMLPFFSAAPCDGVSCASGTVCQTNPGLCQGGTCPFPAPPGSCTDWTCSYSANPAAEYRACGTDQFCNNAGTCIGKLVLELDMHACSCSLGSALPCLLLVTFIVRFTTRLFYHFLAPAIPVIPFGRNADRLF
jgi:hypothetical protein